MVGIKVIDENSNPLKGQNFEWCFWSYTSMGGEVVQGRNVNGLLGNGEWFDQLVRDLAGERLEGWEQGHLGRRHVDALTRVATSVHCGYWTTFIFCANQLISMLYVESIILKFHFSVISWACFCPGLHLPRSR